MIRVKFYPHIRFFSSFLNSRDSNTPYFFQLTLKIFEYRFILKLTPIYKTVVFSCRPDIKT